MPEPTIDDLYAITARHIKNREYAAAQQACEQILRRNPDDSDAWQLAGVIVGNQGEFDTAIKLFERATQIQPKAEYFVNLGHTFLRQGKVEEAAVQYNSALAIDQNTSAAHFNLGCIAARRGSFEEGIQHMLAALRGQPENPRIYRALVSALDESGDGAEAEQICQRGLAVLPDNGLLIEALGDCRLSQGRTDEAREYYDRALASAPENSELRLKRLLSLPTIVNSREHIQQIRDELRADLDKLLERPPQVATSLDDSTACAFNLAYHGLDDLEFHRDIAELKRRIHPSLEFTAAHCRKADYAPLAGRRIRIGFISQMFYNHTIGKLTAGFMKELDSSSFEKTVFTFRRIDDPWRRSIAQNADQFVELPRDLAAARRRIAEAELDVLFYTDIGMEMTTYHLAFARLAPVQCVYWGHPVTTGIPTIDYFMSSEALEPPDAEKYYTEKLVRLKHLTTYYYRPEMPAEKVDRSKLNLAADANLYVCPQSLFKFHPDFDEILKEILQRDPKADIVIIAGKKPAWQDLLAERFRANVGNCADRIVFVPRMGSSDFLQLMLSADVMLDPIHFGGGNTSLEAFAGGTPIVTWPGGLLRSRITYACYVQMGVHDCIASSAEEYVDLAVRIATDAEFRCTLQAKIIAAAPKLYECAAAVRELEDFFIDAVGKCHARS